MGKSENQRTLNLLMIYDNSTRDSFDESARAALDSLLERFGKVEVLSPSETIEKDRWFVQVWAANKLDYPLGAFGSSPTTAASRLLKLARTWGQ